MATEADQGHAQGSCEASAALAEQARGVGTASACFAGRRELRQGRRKAPSGLLSRRLFWADRLQREDRAGGDVSDGSGRFVMAWRDFGPWSSLP